MNNCEDLELLICKKYNINILYIDYNNDNKKYQNYLELFFLDVFLNEANNKKVEVIIINIETKTLKSIDLKELKKKYPNIKIYGRTLYSENILREKYEDYILKLEKIFNKPFDTFELIKELLK